MLLKFNITSEMKYPVSFGSVDAENGTFVRFYGHRQSKDYVRQAIMCSSAVPLLFPYQPDPSRSSDAFYFDGGTALMIDIPGALNLCTEQGYSDEDIILDTVYCTCGSIPMDWNTSVTYHPLEVF